MKIGIILLVLSVLFLIATGLFAGGIMLIGLSSDSLRRIDEVPGWIPHLLLPSVVMLLLFGVLLPPLILYFEHSWFSAGMTASAAFFLAIVVFCAGGIGLLPSK